MAWWQGGVRGHSPSEFSFQGAEGGSICPVVHESPHMCSCLIMLLKQLNYAESAKRGDQDRHPEPVSAIVRFLNSKDRR